MLQTMFCGFHLSTAQQPFSSWNHLSWSQESCTQDCVVTCNLQRPMVSFRSCSWRCVYPYRSFPVAQKQLLAPSLYTYGVRWRKPSSLNFPVRGRSHTQEYGVTSSYVQGERAQMLCCQVRFPWTTQACHHMSGQHRDINREGSKEP